MWLEMRRICRLFTIVLLAGLVFCGLMVVRGPPDEPMVNKVKSELGIAVDTSTVTPEVWWPFFKKQKPNHATNSNLHQIRPIPYEEFAFAQPTNIETRNSNFDKHKMISKELDMAGFNHEISDRNGGSMAVQIPAENNYDKNELESFDEKQNGIAEFKNNAQPEDFPDQYDKVVEQEEYNFNGIDKEHELNGQNQVYPETNQGHENPESNTKQENLQFQGQQKQENSYANIQTYQDLNNSDNGQNLRSQNNRQDSINPNDRHDLENPANGQDLRSQNNRQDSINPNDRHDLENPANGQDLRSQNNGQDSINPNNRQDLENPANEQSLRNPDKGHDLRNANNVLDLKYPDNENDLRNPDENDTDVYFSIEQDDPDTNTFNETELLNVADVENTYVSQEKENNSQNLLKDDDVSTVNNQPIDILIDRIAVNKNDKTAVNGNDRPVVNGHDRTASK